MEELDLRFAGELALWGDGGFWTDRLVAPLVALFAFEMDAMSAAEEDHCYRLVRAPLAPRLHACACSRASAV